MNTFASDQFESWLLSETQRARARVAELKKKYPSAASSELAQRLIDTKKAMAATAGAVSGLMGLFSIPADLAAVAYLQLSLIVDLGVLYGKNMKSMRGQEEVFEIFWAVNSLHSASVRSGPLLISRVLSRAFALRGFKLLSRSLPLISSPLTAYLNQRELEKVAREAMRVYSILPNLVHKHIS